MEDFKEKFNAILGKKQIVHWEDLKPEVKFTDLGLNSLDMLELIIEFEKVFRITISDDDFQKIITVRHAEEYLKSRLNINN